ncbi:MAG: CPBP family intramembrane glutamic endopeptidase [Myxococcales bacterium]
MTETMADPDRGALRAGAAIAGYVALLVGFFTIGLATQGRSIVLGLWVTEGLAIALPAILALRSANVRFGPYLGLRAPTPRQAGIAVVLGLANQPVVSLLTWAARLSVPPDWAEAFDSKQRMLETIFSAQAVPFLATVVIAAPFGEELFFRGFAFPAFRRAMGPAAAAITTGAMFSLIHLDPVGFLGLWEIGILLAFLRLGTGTLWTCVLCHAVNNGIAGAAFLLGWEDPASPPPVWLLVLGAILLVAGIVAAVRVLRRPAPFAPEVPEDFSQPTGFRRFRSPELLAIWVCAVLVAAGQMLNVVPPFPMTAWVVLCAVAAGAIVVAGVRETSRE